jgi:hypothetical protein
MSIVERAFFWGPPSRKRIAWAGWTSGLVVAGVAALLLALGHGATVFVLALLGVGLANLGWAAELFPRGLTALAGWIRVARWLCAIGGAILAILSLAWGLSFGTVVGIVIAGGALAQVLEFAPCGPANKP